MRKMITVLAVSGMLAAAMILPRGGHTSPLPPTRAISSVTAPATLSVMTFNVKGLPWPVAWGRPAALQQIGEHLAEMRRKGTQPQIVLLQEAFTDDAKAIGALAGYRYSLLGPGANSPPMPRLPKSDATFSDDASWLKGEDLGQWTDSGLVILSDYPLAKGAQQVFPNDTCAGYDCLSSKGIELAWVSIPGHAEPLAILDTHLNSRHSSGVSEARANHAFERQFALAGQFIEKHLPGRASAIFGGDFNIGQDAERLGWVHRLGSPLRGSREAMKTAFAQHRVDPQSLPDALQSVDKGKDIEYFRSTPSFPLALRDVRVIFGTQGPAGNLSDHIGYAADYRLN